jgi:cytosine/adenosine deaminase-related metal-dependent hydrolase
MWNNGIVAVGDICNTSQSLAVKRKSSIYYQNFIELFGSNEHHAPALFLKAQKLVSDFEQGGLQATITPHSLYSLSESLLAMIVKHQAQKQELLSIHFMESEEEIEFFAQRTGKIIERLQSFGITPLQFENLRVRPSEIAETALNNDLSTLFVHNTFAENEDVLRIINEFTSPWFCLCPKANLYIENRLPNIELLIKNQVQITVGTDSLASNQTLSILEELTIIQQNYPEISTATLLQWATENGAKFLQIEKKFGLISIGKAPGINLISCENGLLSNAKGVKRVV